VFCPREFFALIDSNSKLFNPLLNNADNRKEIASIITNASLLPYGNIKVVYGDNKRYNLNHPVY